MNYITYDEGVDMTLNWDYEKLLCVAFDQNRLLLSHLVCLSSSVLKSYLYIYNKGSPVLGGSSLVFRQKKCVCGYKYHKNIRLRLIFLHLSQLWVGQLLFFLNFLDSFPVCESLRFMCGSSKISLPHNFDCTFSCLFYF